MYIVYRQFYYYYMMSTLQDLFQEGAILCGHLYLCYL